MIVRPCMHVPEHGHVRAYVHLHVSLDAYIKTCSIIGSDQLHNGMHKHVHVHVRTPDSDATRPAIGRVGKRSEVHPRLEQACKSTYVGGPLIYTPPRPEGSPVPCAVDG